jgi:hypothetical protein
MIRAAKIDGPAFRTRHHGRGVVAAYVEKAAENTIVGSDDDDGFFSDFSSKILSRITNLVGAPDELPGAGNDGAQF